MAGTLASIQEGVRPRKTNLAPQPSIGSADFPPTIIVDLDNFREPRTALQLSWAQLQKLADDFDLGRVVQMDVPTQTQCNTTDPFRTGQGTFLLRARHGEEFVERVEYLHSVINGLRELHFPVPAVMQKRNGKSWTLWGERLVEIHQFVAHDTGSHRDWRRMNAAASVLGDLHRSLATVTRTRTPVPPEMRNDIGPLQCMTLLDEAEIIVGQYRGLHPQAAEAKNVIMRARHALGPLIANYERIIGNLPWLTVHGDFHFWNLLYKADQIAAVVDYDFLQERERLFDIAYAMQSILAHLSRMHGTGAERISKQAWQNVRLWVDLYDESTHLPLTVEERTWLPNEILRVFLVSVATSGSQDDPIELLVNCGQDLDFYIWISRQTNMFL